MDILITYGLYIGIFIMILGLIFMTYPLWSSESKQWVMVTVGGAGAATTIVGFMLAFGSYSVQQDLGEPTPENVEAVEESPAPDFDFNLLGDDARAATLSEYKGDVVLINFWATWCAPCVHEMPALSQLQETYSDDLTVLCISDETSDTVYDFLDDFEPLVQPIGVLESVSELPGEYTMMQQIRPVSYVIDREGIIREVIRGARSYEQFEAEIRPYL